MVSVQHGTQQKGALATKWATGTSATETQDSHLWSLNGAVPAATDKLQKTASFFTSLLTPRTALGTGTGC